MGLLALLYLIILTTLWMWLGDPHTPYYGYYTRNEYTLKDFVLNVIVYMFSFDTWFYFTH